MELQCWLSCSNLIFHDDLNNEYIYMKLINSKYKIRIQPHNYNLPN